MRSSRAVNRGRHRTMRPAMRTLVIEGELQLRTLLCTGLFAAVNVVHVQLYRLRALSDRDSDPAPIHTVRGHGHRLGEP